MTMNKLHLENEMKRFEETTGIKCRYEQQRGNGSYIWLGTKDNNGCGMYIGVNGYIDAMNTLDSIKMSYNIAKTNKV